MTLFIYFSTRYQSVTVKNNSTIQDYFHSDDHTKPSYVIYDSWVQTPHNNTIIYIVVPENIHTPSRWYYY